MECPVCFNLYKIDQGYAVRLECYHVMCINCLNSLKTKKILKCPVCFNSFKETDDISKCETIKNMLIALSNEEIVETKEESEEVSFLIRNFKGNFIDMKLNRNQRVADIKSVVAKIEGLRENTQWLLYKGKALRDEETIGSCGIDQGSMIYLVVRTFGG